MKKFTLILKLIITFIICVVLTHKMKAQTWNLNCQQPLNISDSLELVKIFGKTTANDYSDWFYFDFLDTLNECRVKGIGGYNFPGYVVTDTVKLEISNFPYLDKLNFTYINLSELIASNLPSLENITLSNMGANNITFHSLPNLKNINAEDLSAFSMADWTLESLPNINEIRISSSDLENLSHFTNLPALKRLILTDNNFNIDTITTINLPSIELLNLQGNRLKGTLKNLVNITMLKELNLSSNSLTGAIPDIENLPLLQKLNLTNNLLSGEIPNFASLPLLQELAIDANNLVGRIPNFANIPLLKKLNLSNNQLTGLVPNFNNLPVISDLTVCGGDNEFIGPIPTLENCPLLNNVSFSCVGPPPENTDIPVSESDSLVLVNLYQSTDGENWEESEGWLTRNLEAWWGIELKDTVGEKRVTKILIRGIPDGVTLPSLNLPFLEELILDYNNFAGELPDLSNLTNLKTLNLEANNFTGSFPDLSVLSQLEEINLASNELSGVLQPFAEQPNLNILNLGGNNLSGEIPNFNHPFLTQLNLSDNQLSGSIPDFDALPELGALNLSNNFSLEGTIPNFSSLPNLVRLSLAANNLQGTIPDFDNLNLLEYLDVHENELTGSIPDFSNLPNLTSLDVSNNQLSGTISDFSNLPLLKSLYVNDNQLEGQLPNFSKLPALMDLRLCDNPLVGIVPNFSLSPLLDISLIDFSCIQSAKVSGRVYYDANENCVFDEGDTPIPNGLISVNNGANYQPVDEQGNYEVAVEVGTSLITFIQTSPLWASSCENTQTITALTVNDVTELDFANQPNIECTELTVDIGTPFLRRCFKNTYTVQYCNQGTQPAIDAYIEIDFDEAIIPLSASIPYEEANNLLTFQLGEIGIGECGTFTVIDSVACEAPLSSTGCVEAHIYPDGYCQIPSTLWDRANLKVNAFCLNDDSVQFVIENVGEDMADISRYKMYVEDLFTAQGEFQLQSGASKVLNYEATGATYKVSVEQTPGHPSQDNPQAFFEFCGDGNFSTGFINSQLLPDKDEFIDIDCEEIIGSYDPNDKLVTPAGVGESNDIYKGDELTYKIRFQNTGNDTAFTVVLIDTLDFEHLNMSTLEVLNSSHPYTLSIEDAQILTFTFNNILLVDSTTNEPESHGFVTFKIDQFKENEIGEVIENKAYIYFDFNEPIVTPTVFNTIAEPRVAANFQFIPLTVGIESDLINHLFAKVYPNPAKEIFYMELPDEVLHQYPNLILEMYNTQGQAILSNHLNRAPQSINIANFNKGIFYYKLFSDKNTLANGKLLIQ